MRLLTRGGGRYRALAPGYYRIAPLGLSFGSAPDVTGLNYLSYDVGKNKRSNAGLLSFCRSVTCNDSGYKDLTLRRQHLLQQFVEALEHQARVIQQAGGHAGVVVNLLSHFRGQRFIGLPHLIEADDDGVARI